MPNVQMLAGHKEHATPHGRKIDPTYSMDTMRAKVAERLAGTTQQGDRPRPPTAATATKPKPKVYLSRLRYGRRDSDSVRHLQRRLNGVHLRGGRDLPVTGNFLALTLSEVKKWQTQIPHDPPDGRLGPKQAALLFGAGYQIINDL